MQFPRTLLAFHEVFPDEAACLAFLRRSRWPRGFQCPRCGGRRSYMIAGRHLEQCARCRYQASVTAGTIFHKTRVPLRTWFLAIFLVGRDAAYDGPRAVLARGEVISRSPQCQSTSFDLDSFVRRPASRSRRRASPRITARNRSRR